LLSNKEVRHEHIFSSNDLVANAEQAALLQNKALSMKSEIEHALPCTAADFPLDDEALAQMPPVKPEHIRLYRGETIPSVWSLQLTCCEWLVSVAKSIFGADRAFFERASLNDLSKLIQWHKQLNAEGVSSRWFTSSLRHAKWYWYYNRSGTRCLSRIRFVDVPTAQVIAASQDSLAQEWSKHPGEFFLPIEYRNKIDGVVPYRLYKTLRMTNVLPNYSWTKP
jgi:hypothetical protein